MPDSRSPDLQFLRDSLESQGVKYALASFADIHGMCKAKVVPLAHLNQMMAGSELFTGAALDGVPQAINDQEVAAMPDLDSAIILPWNPEIVWFASDLYIGDEPLEACCRTILKNVLAQAAEMGYRFNLGIETEFFVLKKGEQGLTPVSDTLAKPCYDLQGMLDNYSWISELVEAMN